jgi:hypothetical protein
MRSLNLFRKLSSRISDNGYAIGLTAIFLVVGTITALRHEMWRDEIQAWLIARDSASVIDLLRNLKYEGHPGLWHLCLTPLSRITWSPGIMQGFHLLIAATTAYLFARFSPFTRLQKFLFAFGYFSLYEYSIICRNYALGVLLLCLFCMLFQHRYARFLRVGVVLFLLAHTSAHALILTIGIGFALLLDYLVAGRKVQKAVGWNERKIWLGFGVIALGVATSVLQLKPPADTGFAVGWYLRYDANRVKEVIKIITHAFLPVPEVRLHFWGSRLLETYPPFGRFQLHLCYFLFGLTSCVLLRRPTALLIYLIGTIGLLVFFYVKYLGSIRHHGFLFMLFVVVAWIYRYCPEIRFKPIHRFSGFWEKLLSPILTLILVFHLIGGVNAVRMDYRYPFSNGKAATTYIRENGMADALIVGEGDYAVSTIVGYLKTARVYYPRGSRFGSFIVWDMARTPGVSNDRILEDARKLQTQTEKKILIILNYPLDRGWTDEHSLTELARFTGSTIGDEGFYLYLLK